MQYDCVWWQLLDDRDVCYQVGGIMVATGIEKSMSSCALMQSPCDNQRETIEPLCARP
jgi:hypothetical protein